MVKKVKVYMVIKQQVNLSADLLIARTFLL